LEFLHPLAVTVLGGLVTSCVVLLFLLPPLLPRTWASGSARTPEPVVAAPAPTDGVRTEHRPTPIAPRQPVDDMISPASTHRPGDEGNE
jgi:hypothetical protein